MYSIDVRYPTSEYLHIREYSEICTVISQIFWHLYEHVKNAFNMSVSVSIDTILYMSKMSEYECLLERVEHALVVNSLILSNIFFWIKWTKIKVPVWYVITCLVFHSHKLVIWCYTILIILAENFRQNNPCSWGSHKKPSCRRVLTPWWGRTIYYRIIQE